jgi:hypothetical protein
MLEVDKNPDDLQSSDTIIFKVVNEVSSGYEDPT